MGVVLRTHSMRRKASTGWWPPSRGRAPRGGYLPVGRCIVPRLNPERPRAPAAPPRAAPGTGGGVRRMSRRSAWSCGPSSARSVNALGFTVRNIGPRTGSMTATTAFALLGVSKTMPSSADPAPPTLTSSPGPARLHGRSLLRAVIAAASAHRVRLAVELDVVDPLERVGEPVDGVGHVVAVGLVLEREPDARRSRARGTRCRPATRAFISRSRSISSRSRSAWRFWASRISGAA